MIMNAHQCFDILDYSCTQIGDDLKKERERGPSWVVYSVNDFYKT